MSSDDSSSAAPLPLQLEKCSRELAQLQHELDSFTYSVAHDLRAPLRGVTGFLDALREDHGSTLQPSAAKYLNNAIDCANRMHAMMEELLEISRLGHRELVLVPVALDRVVADVRATIVIDPSRRPIEWRLSPLPTVVCDPSLVRMVFQTLLSNAVKFTRHAAAPAIEVAQHGRNGASIIKVQDNGLGFDMQRAGNLFTPFFRLHDAAEFGGAATSLAKAAKIVRRHGGRIWADAVEEKGATFSFTLAPDAP